MKNVVLISLFWFVSTFTYASSESDLQSESVVVLKQQHIFLQPFTQSLIDKLDQYTPEQLAMGQISFQRSGSNPQFGYVDGSVWLKYRLKNETEKTNWVMSIRNEHLYRVTAFSYEPGDSESLKLLFHPNDKKRMAEIPIRIKTNDTQHVLLKIKHDSSPIIAPIYMTQSAEHTMYLLKSQFIWVFFLSALITIVFFNLTSYLVVRDHAILAYVVHVLIFCTTQIIAMGHLYFWFPDISWSTYTNYRHISFFLMSLSLCIFIYHFLNLKTVHEKLASWVKILCGIDIILLLVASFVTNDAPVLNFKISMIVCLITLIMMIACAVVAIRHVLYERFYFAVATTVTCIGAVISLLTINGLIAFNGINASAFEIAVFIEIALISIAFRQRQKHAISQELTSATAELEENYTFIEEQSASLDISKRKAEHANQVKSQFLATMSHEFRTPLNAILGFASQLKQTTDNPGLSEQVDIIHESANNLRVIVNDLLDYSQIESGDIQLTPTTFTIEELLADLVSQANREAENKFLELIYFQEVLPRRLTGDKDKIQQIVHHLVRNAIKFTSRGYICIRISHEKVAEGEINLQISVEDSGFGIEKERQVTLFNPLNVNHNTFTRRHQGAGLGLTVSNKLSQMMGGSLTVTSQLQIGSLFSLTVPLGSSQDYALEHTDNVKNFKTLSLVNFSELNQRSVSQLLATLNIPVVDIGSDEKSQSTIIWSESAKAPLTAQNIIDISRKFPNNNIVISCISRTFLSMEDHGLPNNIELLRKPLTSQKLVQVASQRNTKRLSTPLQPLDLSSLQILAVDDMDMNLKLLETWLQPTKIQLTKALSGQDAIALCTDIDFDLILMDIQMPGMDGVQTTQAIRKAGKNQGTPIIAVTAHAFEQEKAEFLQSGMDDHIAKPINLNSLMSMISTWCEIETVNSHIEAFSWEQAVARTQGNEELADSLFQQFKQELAKILPKIHLANKTKNHSDMMSHIHAIHGIACQTGVPRLRSLCDEIEGLFKQGYYNQGYQMMGHFFQACNEIENLNHLRDVVKTH